MKMTALQEEAAFTKPLFREDALAASSEAMGGSYEQPFYGAVRGDAKIDYALPENPTAQVPVSWEQPVRAFSCPVTA